MARFRRLKDAMEILKVIPKENFKLDSQFTKKGPFRETTVACPGVWLSMNVLFRKLGLEVKVFEFNTEYYINGKLMPYYEAMGKIFNMNQDDVLRLFSPRNTTGQDSYIFKCLGEGISDKDLWQERAKKFLLRYDKM